MEFEWDLRKAEAHLAKHGVTFPEAATVLGDPFSWTFPDPEHSEVEERWITVGMSEARRLLVVIHAGDDTTTRVISARQATRREREFYEGT